MAIRFVSAKTDFFERFAALARAALDGAMLLTESLRSGDGVAISMERLREIEHCGDDITREIITALNRTLITPFDRDDIHKLASSLDDVLDGVWTAGYSLVLYNIPVPLPVAAELGGVVVRQCEELSKAIALLRKMDGVLACCAEIGRLEHTADTIVGRALGGLLSGKDDPIAVIKLKDLYETLEDASDAAEDAANVLEAIMLKNQ